MRSAAESVESADVVAHQRQRATRVSAVLIAGRVGHKSKPVVRRIDPLVAQIVEFTLKRQTADG